MVLDGGFGLWGVVIDELGVMASAKIYSVFFLSFFALFFLANNGRIHLLKKSIMNKIRYEKYMMKAICCTKGWL